MSAGSDIGFDIKVGNGGPATATNVSLSDGLPAGYGVSWTLGAVSGSGGFTPPAGARSITGSPPSQTLGCAFGDMASGQGVTVHISSHTNSARSATYANIARAQATNSPPITASASTTTSSRTSTRSS